MSHVAKLIPMAMLALTISLPAQLGYASETDFSNDELLGNSTQSAGCTFTVIRNDSMGFGVKVNSCSSGRMLKAKKPYYLNDNNPRLYYVNGNWAGSPGEVSIAVRPQGTLDGGSGILQYS